MRKAELYVTVNNVSFMDVFRRVIVLYVFWKSYVDRGWIDDIVQYLESAISSLKNIENFIWSRICASVAKWIELATCLLTSGSPQ